MIFQVTIKQKETSGTWLKNQSMFQKRHWYFESESTKAENRANASMKANISFFHMPGNFFSLVKKES